VTLVAAVQFLFRLLYALVLIRVVLSWIPGVSQSHPVVSLVYRVTSPILDPIRRIMPPAGGLDLSPVIALLLLGLLQQVVIDLVARATAF
jgi:YggT family protein